MSKDKQSAVQVKEPKAKEIKKVKPKIPFTKTKFYSNRYIHLMVFITTVFFLVFRYWPILWNVIAFQNFKILKGFTGSKFVGLDNFKEIFSNMPYFMRLLRNTIAMNGLNLILGFPAPIIFALLLNELWGSKFKRTVQTISYLPHFISTVVVVGMTTLLLSPSLGLVNKVIADLGGTKINFLSQPKMFWWIMVATGIWQSVGWSAIIYLSALTSIDPALYEVSSIDGANRWQQTLHITLPGIRNTIMIMFILQIGSLLAVNTEKIFLFQNDLNLSRSEMIPTYIYKRGIVSSDYSKATAAGLINAVISIALVSLANWLSKKYTEVSIM
ncbi:ABC transporter permease [Fastidiosipila sanguinis]|uniref:Sugar ABC transporter permease n=1 Tax=Fastidiosipila sanguinis TaxID=236753 RepID=A0A2S0KLL8_9FIRM|nr:ABC transporter permease subunit [Fastidiosipila sanguinis]AVM41916.1 sugar ABC transporter permease [Fastidiosipila sanguinis]